MFEKNNTVNISQVVVEEDVKGKAFLSRVFGYMAIWLLITTIVAVGAGIGFSYAFTHLKAQSLDNAYALFIGAIIVSFIGILVSGMVINIGSIGGKMNLMVPAVIYSIFMGVFLSTFVMFIEWYVLALSFGITTLTFSGMFLIAKTTKRNLTPLGLAGSGLLMGAFMLMLVVMIMYLVNAFVLSEYLAWTTFWLYVAIEAIMFVAIFLITMYEMWNIVKIAEKGATSRNLAQYCAFSLYTDFIYILIRVAIVLARIFASNRN